MSPPRFETRERPSGGQTLYRCADCHEVCVRTEIVTHDGRYYCIEDATARGLSA
jgi:formylmethanofuran dehydrogenase subunit E